MKSYMLDTNICSYIMREDGASYRRLEQEVLAGSKIYISVVAYYEMLRGAIQPRAPKRTMALLDVFVSGIDGVLSLDSGTAKMAAEIQRQLLKDGTPIGENDALIAAHAITANCICVTNNTREFARVPGLVLENWAA